MDTATKEHGDLLDVIREALGLADFKDLVEEARRFLALPHPEQEKAPTGSMSSAASGSPEASRRLFAMAQPIRGTLAEIYLNGRAITSLSGTAALRFHPRCYYRPDEHSPSEIRPALVAAVTDLAGHQTGAHRTWLAPGGSGKAAVETPRRAMGSSIHGADRNLRGSLFELVVGHVAQARFGGSIDINHFIRIDTFKAEIDVRRVVAGEVWIYECKGYQPDHMIDAPEVEAWLTKKVPGIHSATKAEDRFNSSTVHFEFWTSGGFTGAAIAAHTAARNRTKRYAVGWKSGKEVRSELARLSSSGMAAMFDQQFLKHPIANFDRRHDGAAALGDLGVDATVPGDLDEPFVPALPKRPSRQEIRAEVEAAMAYERMPPPMPAAE